MSAADRKADRHAREGVSARLIRADDDLWRAVDERASRDGLSRTEAVRRAIADWAT